MRLIASTTSLYLCLTCLVPLSAHAAEQFSFEPNLGQTAADVRYVARSANGIAFITDRGVKFRGDGQSVPAFELIGANLSTPWIAEQNNGETISYFVGRDPSKWVENAPHYSRLVRHNVYPGIDFALYGTAGQLEYDFLLAPQADPSRIRLKLTSARGISIDAGGSLVVNTAAGELQHRKPVLYETFPDGSRRSIDGSFIILGRDEVGFAVSDHDPAMALSIDPVLQSSTYFGGHGDDQVIGTDGKGTVVGNTTSIDVSGAPFARRSGMNVFVKQGQRTTVFGCSGNVTATSAAFNGYSQAQIAVGGYTDCPDLPTNFPLLVSPPLQPDYGGGATDGFLLLFFSEVAQSRNTTLSYIGGPGDDRVNAVALNNEVVIAGSSQGGLPQSPNQANTKPSGGLDAFVMSGFAIRSVPLILYSTIYLGGSGDDTALGVAFSTAGSCYITGETKSPDFPLVSALNSKRAGDSDAFIARIPGCNGSPIAVTLFGGSNSDRGVAVATLPFGNIVVAGVTSSTDLPLLNPTQKAYGGGASDAFVAQFTPDLSTLVSSTYIGGAEADEATSIVGSFPSTVFVGGWTSSENFPTVNALQKKYGGGPDDGFLLHFDDDGSIYESTYFGGSGSDRILSLSGFTPSYSGPSYGPTIWLAGTTTSPDLPLENPEHSSLLGPSDGFVAEIDPGLFAVSAVSSVKDVRAAVTIYVGDPSVANLRTFTITSSDPSKVQVASDTTSPGQKSATLIGSGFAPAEIFYADCLTDSGGADLTISASGFRTKTVHASCFPAAITIVSDATNPGTLKTNIGAIGAIQVFAYLVADPKSPVFITGGVTRPGATPIVAQVTNSNSDIGTLSTESLVFNNSAYPSVTFTPLTIGTTNLIFSAGDIPFLPSNTLTINVGGSYQTPYPFPVPVGFQTPLQLTPSADQTGKILTVTSQDPSRVAVSLDSTKRGGKSVAVPWYSLNQSIWVQAFASTGDVQLTMSVTGEPDIKTTVHLTTPVAVLSTQSNIVSQPVVLPQGKTALFFFHVTAAGGLGNYSLNPGTTPLTATLQSSHSNVLNIVAGRAQIAPGAPTDFTFEVTGAAAGSTVVTVQDSAHIPNSPTGSSLTVNVIAPNTKNLFPDVEVGEGLIAPMSLTLPESASSDVLVTLSVDDPTLALLSLDNTKAGLPQITTVITAGSEGTQFFVYGLASSGQAKVTATLPGSVLTANVNLDRSGFYWTDETLDSTGGGIIQESLLVGPLDTASSIPVGTQALQPGIAGTIGIASSNSSIASADSINLPLANPSPGAPITIAIQTKPAATGSATLSLHQPSGFSAPSVRQKLVVNVAKSSIAISPGVLGKNTQTPLNITVPYGTAPTLTIRSSDPSKVLLSANPGKLGSGSVPVVAGKTVYAQALAASGSVTIKVSGAGLIGASQVFSLAPTGFGITLDQLNTTQSGGKFFSSLLSKPASVQVSLYQGSQQIYPLTLLPGLGSLSTKITSSNTSVATIAGSPSSLPLGTPATVTPVGAGETVISISQPPGFTSVGNDTLTLDVVAPSLSVSGFIAARDTLSGGSITLPQGLAPMTADLAVTVTSSDPSRILVSSDPAAAPGATATITIKAGSQSANYFAHVLSDNGKVPIQITAPGFAASALTAELVPLSFEFTSTTQIVTTVQGAPQIIGVEAVPLEIAGRYAPIAPLRPGIPPITVSVSSSNPQIVSISPSKLVFQGNIPPSPITLTPLKAGTATLKLTAPSAYPVLASRGQLPIVVNAAKIALPSSLLVGKDLVTQVQYSITSASNKSMTVTSSNPSVLLVSPDPSTAGQASLIVQNPAFGGGLFAQAFASRGTATLTFTMSGFPTATLPVTLTPVGAVFGITPIEPSVAVGSAPVQYPVYLVPLDPVTLEPNGPGIPRPGASFTITATSSDPKIVSITTPTVTPGGSLGIQPLAVGTAIVTLAPIAGNPAPASGNLIVLNVYQP